MKHPQQPLCGRRRARIAADLAERFIQDQLSVAELSTLVRRRPSTVRRLLTEAGIQTTGPACVGLSKQETARILARRYEAGASIVALVRQTGMDKRAIRTMLVDAGVDLPVSHPLTADEAEQVVARYQAGESIRTLAASMGCSYGTIRAALHAAQVPMRPRGDNRHQGGRPCR